MPLSIFVLGIHSNGSLPSALQIKLSLPLKIILFASNFILELTSRSRLDCIYHFLQYPCNDSQQIGVSNSNSSLSSGRSSGTMRVFGVDVPLGVALLSTVSNAQSKNSLDPVKCDALPPALQLQLGCFQNQPSDETYNKLRNRTGAGSIYHRQNTNTVCANGLVDVLSFTGIDQVGLHNIVGNFEPFELDALGLGNDAGIQSGIGEHTTLQVCATLDSCSPTGVMSLLGSYSSAIQLVAGSCSYYSSQKACNQQTGGIILNPSGPGSISIATLEQIMNVESSNNIENFVVRPVSIPLSIDLL
jgi:hypothetical protein